MAVQTRSDSQFGKFPGVSTFSDLSSAYAAWQEDTNIWKISWMDKDRHYRFRPIYKNQLISWNDKSIEKIRSLCPSFQNARGNDLFWVDQSTFPDISVREEIMDANFQNTMHQVDPEKYPAVEIPYQDLSSEQKDHINMARCLHQVLTNQEFKEKYL